MSAVPTYTAVHRLAIDELLEAYVPWRESCGVVWRAYERWTGSDRGERPPAYAAHLAALDGEERAARTYARDLVDDLAALKPGRQGHPHSGPPIHGDQADRRAASQPSRPPTG